jgi:predicted tellurium resistance membrane protein TerC
MEATHAYARARRFFLTPPSVPVFFISIALAILALLVTYGYVTAIRSSYAFVVLLISYALLMIGCLFRRV